MNAPLLFLLGAIALSALGGLVVWIASRPRPERFGSTIDTFTKDLDALAPPGTLPNRPIRSAVAQGRPAPNIPRTTPSPAPMAGHATRPRPGPRPTGRPGGN